MENTNIPVLNEDYFFRPGCGVHIQRSSECMEYVGVLHKHTFVEIVYIISGRAKHVLGDNTYWVQKGDVVVINPNEAHAFLEDKDCPETFLAYDLMFTPDFIDRQCLQGDDFSALADSFLFLSLFPEDHAISSKLYLIPQCSYDLYSMFDKVYFEYNRVDIGYLNLIRIYVAEIIILLLRRIHELEQSSLTASQKALVKEVMGYIQDNYNIPIRTSEIASNLFFNRNYISKLFRKETGRSIHEFVREIRMHEARKLLSTTRIPVAEIARKCGFQDLKTFYQFFKKYTGVTPKNYRDSVSPKEE